MTDEERLLSIRDELNRWDYGDRRNGGAVAETVLTRIRALLDDGTYSGSRFVSPAPGVMSGAITPEARELINEIFAAWNAHVPNVRPNNDLIGITTPDGEALYGFVYWLCRWSGLVRPARAILDDAPSVEWRDAERASDAWLGEWRLAVWQLPGQSLWTVHASTIRGPSVDEWRLPDRASAKARAVALYVALRGAT